MLQQPLQEEISVCSPLVSSQQVFQTGPKTLPEAGTPQGVARGGYQGGEEADSLLVLHTRSQVIWKDRVTLSCCGMAQSGSWTGRRDTGGGGTEDEERRSRELRMLGAVSGSGGRQYTGGRGSILREIARVRVQALPLLWTSRSGPTASSSLIAGLMSHCEDCPPRTLHCLILAGIGNSCPRTLRHLWGIGA